MQKVWRNYKRGRMKLLQSTLERYFTVEHKGKTYYVGFIDSDGYVGFVQPGWGILDEELEELDIYVHNDTTKKVLKQIEKNAKLREKLIKFCIKHFEDYRPDPNDW